LIFNLIRRTLKSWPAWSTNVGVESYVVKVGDMDQQGMTLEKGTLDSYHGQICQIVKGTRTAISFVICPSYYPEQDFRYNVLTKSTT
jgi:hypothetical protein